jgi:outer membrane protein assembly factor BamB
MVDRSRQTGPRGKLPCRLSPRARRWLLWIAVAALLVFLVTLAGNLYSCGMVLYPGEVLPLADNRFVATSWGPSDALLDSGGDVPSLPSDRVYCLDAAGKILWSVDLDGYLATSIDASPATGRVAVSAMKSGAGGSVTVRVLLIDTTAQRPVVKVLREIESAATVWVDLARDGQSVAIFVEPYFTGSEVNGMAGMAVGYTAEVIDAAGNSLWKLPVPADKALYAEAMDDSLTTAVLTMVEDPNLQSAEVLVCRPSFTKTLSFSAPPTAEVSPDGHLIAIGVNNPATSSAKLTLYSLDTELKPLWTADAVSGGVFNADGTMLVSSSFGDPWTAVSPSGQNGWNDTVQVRSAADGSILWEQTMETHGTWSAGMTRFACAFVYYQDPGPDHPPQTAYLVELTGAKPEVRTLAPTDLWRAIPSYDGSAVLGIDHQGLAVPVPIR